MITDLKEFIEAARWKRASNYIGTDFSEWCQGLSQGRYSDSLTESNFQSALELLGGEREGIVEVHRFSCWAGGWFETIMVNPKNLKAIKKLHEIHLSLESYGVLDDDDYSERQYEKQMEDLKFYMDDFCEAVLNFCGIDKDDQDFESLKNDSDVQQVASALYSDACGYYGTDEAFVYADSIDKFACVYNLMDLAKNNPCAELVLACMGKELENG